MTQHNTADRKDIRRAEKDARLSERADADVIKALASHTAGREWLWNRLEECHVFSTVWSSDARQMAFNEGERNMGLRLLTQIMEHCPENFTLAMKEAYERRTHSRSVKRPGDPGRGDLGAEHYTSDDYDRAADHDRAGDDYNQR